MQVGPAFALRWNIWFKHSVIEGMYVFAQIVFTAVFVFFAYIVRGIRHPAQGRVLLARYGARLPWRVGPYALAAALVLGGLWLSTLILEEGGKPLWRLGVLDALAADFVVIQAILGAVRRGYAAVTADGIFLPGRTLPWTDVHEAWWDGSSLWVQLTPQATTAAPPAPFAPRSFRAPPQNGKLVILDGWHYRFSTAEYTALRDSLPALQPILREWRFGTGRAPLHHRLARSRVP